MLLIAPPGYTGAPRTPQIVQKRETRLSRPLFCPRGPFFGAVMGGKASGKTPVPGYLVRGFVCTIRTSTRRQMYNLKNLAFWAKSKIGIFACFLCKTNSLRRPGGLFWPIGVTAALSRRMLPWDGHKLVKEKINLGPKVPQIVHFSTGRFFFFF